MSEDTVQLPTYFSTMMSCFVSTAPGRLCLFGEHQDYLHLPVIAAALPLTCQIQVTPTPNSRILELEIPALDTTLRCDLDNLPPSPGDSMDFMLSAIHEVLKDGWELPYGAKCVSSTDIPMQAGVSSSSAFCVAWVQALAKLANQTKSPLEIAQMAHKAEVTHFGAPGGTMDHVTSALGGIVRIGPDPWQIQTLSSKQGVWVLADSGEPKDTMKHLRRCKHDRLELYRKLGNCWSHAPSSVDDLTAEEKVLLEATLTNKTTEEEAALKWNSASGQELGALMLKHHEALSHGLQLSTKRLEAMKDAAMDNGAWGYKLVGSGGGGCAVAWCSENVSQQVTKAMEEAGAVKTYLITEPFHGAKIEESNK